MTHSGSSSPSGGLPIHDLLTEFDRDATVDVLSAVIVSKAPGAGTFIAGLSNNSGSEAITFEAIRPVNDTSITFDDLEPREIPPLGFENLSEQGNGVGVTGDFTAGDFVSIQLAFDNGESVEMSIPVVTRCTNEAPSGTPKRCSASRAFAWPSTVVRRNRA